MVDYNIPFLHSYQGSFSIVQGITMLKVRFTDFNKDFLDNSCNNAKI